MRRREFIAILGGVVAVWPLTVRAQQSERVRRIGVLVSGGIETDQQAGVALFREVLHQLGWIDGRNVRLEVRWAGADPAKARKGAEELVALPADVILVVGALGCKRCCKGHARCRLYSIIWSIRSVPASSTAWLDREVTRLALFNMTMH